MSPAMKCAAVALAALVLISAGSAPARAQSPERIYRLGHLAVTEESVAGNRRSLLPELARLGFVEGRNLVFDARTGAVGDLPGLMRELLAARPDAIVTIGPATRVAGAATRTVPIVSSGSDPVELGLAASLARPGGNVTGITLLVWELDAKRLDLLREAVPGRRRVAVLFASAASNQQRQASEREMRGVAANAGIDLLDFTVAAAVDYPAAFAAMRAAGAQALVIGAAPQFSAGDMPILAALALEARLPTICEWARNVRDGCLLGYGPDFAALRRRMADQVARIFRGAAPRDIPIELPTLFEFAVNLKVAKALGLTLPPAIIARADEVIE